MSANKVVSSAYQRQIYNFIHTIFIYLTITWPYNSFYMKWLNNSVLQKRLFKFSCLLSLLYVPSQKKVELCPSNSQSSERSKTQVRVVQSQTFCKMVPTFLQSQLSPQGIQMSALQHHHLKHNMILFPQDSPRQG